MGEAAKIPFRGWLAVIVGSALLVAGLVALTVPVFLDEFDKYGIKIDCGNGIRGQSAQASANDRVDQCTNALAFRRAWAIPAASLGTLILIPTMVMWARQSVVQPDSGTAPGEPWSVANPDSAIHDAAVLDRRESQHRHRPSNTTL